MRRQAVISLVGGLVLVLATCLQAAEPAVDLSVATDRPDAIYSVGQPIKFLVTAKQGGKPLAGGELVCTFDTDGMPPTITRNVKVVEGAASVEGSLDKPGFLRCRVTLGAAGKTGPSAMASAGVDPLKIAPSMPVPNDFDSFWTQQKARLAAVPLKPILTPVEAPKGLECFDAEIPCVAPRPVCGYFARPAGAGPKSLPAILMVQRAGTFSNTPNAPVDNAGKFNALVLDINAHGLPNKNPELFKEIAGQVTRTWEIGRDDREQAYFLGMYLRVARAIEFLTAQREWDGKTLIVRGGSQGGGQAVVAAGLNPRVSFIAANVPAMCDHTGCAIGRASGWPGMVPKDANGKPDPKVLQVARYFDGMNFATRSKAAAIFDVGFLDPHCPPTSVYAMYNNWPGKKQIVNLIKGGHDYSGNFGDAAIAQHIAEQKAAGR